MLQTGASIRYFSARVAPPPSRLVTSDETVIIAPGAAPDVLRVIQAREQGDDIVASIHDLQDRDAAQALRGCRLFVPRSSFPTAGWNQYRVEICG